MILELFIGSIALLAVALYLRSRSNAPASDTEAES